MSLEAKGNPEKGNPQETPAEKLGSLGVCLVDGDAEQRARERKVRRRALAISILSQSAALALFLLVPLFSKTERIVVKAFVPVPPYGHPHSPSTGDKRKQNGGPPTGDPIPDYPLRPSAHPRPADGDPVPPDEIGPGGPTTTEGRNCPWCVNIGNQSKGPLPPQQETTVREKPRVLRMTSIDPAMLLRRVEPVYPVLAKQIHKEGRVELRAIIATDGTIQSLQVISGDALFIPSAKEAVLQWRYKPTYLNGQAVEIDTYITVVYSLQH